MEGGYELRALVFLVIAVTVVFAGLTGGFMAGLLKLRRPSQTGWVILGANEVARNVAKLFKENGQEVVSIDSNTDHAKAAEDDCTRVIYGNGLQTRNLRRAEIDTRRGALALTANDEINFLFAQKVNQEARELSLYAALKSDSSFTTEMLEEIGVDLAFGAPGDIDTWTRRFKARQIYLQRWSLVETEANLTVQRLRRGYSGNGLLIAGIQRDQHLFPAGKTTLLQKNDEIMVFVFEPELEAVESFFTKTGWRRLENLGKNEISASVCHLDEDKS